MIDAIRRLDTGIGRLPLMPWRVFAWLPTFAGAVASQVVGGRATPGHDTETKATSGHDANTKATSGYDTDTKAASNHDTKARATPDYDTKTKATSAHNTKVKATSGHNTNTKSTPGYDTKTKATSGHDAKAKTTSANKTKAKATFGHDTKAKATSGYDPKAQASSGHAANMSGNDRSGDVTWVAAQFVERRVLPGYARSIRGIDRSRGVAWNGLAAVVLLVGGCMVGPDYQRAEAPEPVAFKELAGWKISQPADAADKGAWWSVYHDPELDRLERMVEVSNQTVKQFEAQYRNAVALVAEARSSLFPTASLSAGVTRSGSGLSARSSSFGSSSSRSGTQYTASGTIAWDLDVWGRIRRQVESSTAAAQISAADLASAKLSAQATLAIDYFDLRAEDALAQLLADTVANDRRALRITENQYHAGTTSSIDYVTALAQLQSTEAQLVAVGVQRHQFEHAIAVLTGHTPAEITIAQAPLAADVPVAPPGLPSALLERRPDVAAAERAMQETNALIGVQIAAYYPDISLSALGEYAGSPAAQLFNASNRLWSLGASGAETVFSGGLRSGAVAAARANYDASVASYRQVVLTAFQQVEDALSNLRILEQQARAEAIAIDSTRRAVEATLNAYRAGTVAYTSVITEQSQLLANQQAALSVQQSRLVASVALIQALGGGWSTADLPQRIATPNPLLP